MNTTYLLTQASEDGSERYPAWKHLLGQRVALTPGASQDVNASIYTTISNLTGVVKAVAVSDGPAGQLADVAVEFPYTLTGAHTCNGTCEPQRGLWFGYRNVAFLGA